MRQRALADLRHLYKQMLDGNVKDTAEAARGLLGPAIAALESPAFAIKNVREALTEVQAVAPGLRLTKANFDSDNGWYLTFE